MQLAIAESANAVESLIPAPRAQHGLAVGLVDGELHGLPSNAVFAQAVTRVVGEVHIHARTLADR